MITVCQTFLLNLASHSHKNERRFPAISRFDPIRQPALAPPKGVNLKSPQLFLFRFCFEGLLKFFCVLFFGERGRGGCPVRLRLEKTVVIVMTSIRLSACSCLFATCWPCQDASETLLFTVVQSTSRFSAAQTGRKNESEKPAGHSRVCKPGKGVSNICVHLGRVCRRNKTSRHGCLLVDIQWPRGSLACFVTKGRRAPNSVSCFVWDWLPPAELRPCWVVAKSQPFTFRSLSQICKVSIIHPEKCFSPFSRFAFGTFG